MAKVSKSVREKRKDFSKTKLKVGKTKQVPANQTDTSFRSKAIVLPKQSVTREVGVKEARTLQHFLGLVTHKSGDTRRDAMQQMTAHLASHPPTVSTTLTPLMKALCPMMIDDTTAVRKLVLELFRTVLLETRGVRREALNSHTQLVLLYIASAMTHIAPSIRADSTKFLGWAMTATNATQVILTSQLKKFMETFATLFGWVGQSSQLSHTKSLVTHLATFNVLLEAALEPAVETQVEGVEYIVPMAEQDCFVPHRHTAAYLDSNHQGLVLFRANDKNDADLSHYHSIEPHLPAMTTYLSDKFTDSVNGDRSLCLPILEIIKTLGDHESVRDRRDFKSALKKIARGMETLSEVGGGQNMGQGLVGIWRIIQDESL